MGIVNVTPDSFSGDGIESEGGATEYALSQLSLGADLLDLGGESTRPGHQPVDERVEMARVIPVIDAVRRGCPGAPISIDTYKPDVARAARIAGADMINSVWGTPPELLDVAAELEMPIVAMHNQSGTHYDGPSSMRSSPTSRVAPHARLHAEFVPNASFSIRESVSARTPSRISRCSRGSIVSSPSAFRP